MNQGNAEYDENENCIIIYQKIDSEDFREKVESYLEWMRCEVDEMLLQDVDIDAAHKIVNEMECRWKSADCYAALKKISEKMHRIEDFNNAVIWWARDFSGEDIKKLERLLDESLEDIIKEWNTDEDQEDEDS